MQHHGTGVWCIIGSSHDLNGLLQPSSAAGLQEQDQAVQDRPCQTWPYGHCMPVKPQHNSKTYHVMPALKGLYTPDMA